MTLTTVIILFLSVFNFIINKLWIYFKIYKVGWEIVISYNTPLP
mgnify:CR=1 FL=1